MANFLTELRRDLARYKKWFDYECEKNKRLQQENENLKQLIINDEPQVLIAEYIESDHITLITKHKPTLKELLNSK